MSATISITVGPYKICMWRVFPDLAVNFLEGRLRLEDAMERVVVAFRYTLPYPISIESYTNFQKFQGQNPSFLSLSLSSPFIRSSSRYFLLFSLLFSPKHFCLWRVKWTFCTQFTDVNCKKRQTISDPRKHDFHFSQFDDDNRIRRTSKRTMLSTT